VQVNKPRPKRYFIDNFGVSHSGLAALGVEIQVADYNEPETVKGAFKGAYGVFAVTNCHFVFLILFSHPDIAGRQSGSPVSVWKARFDRGAILSTLPWLRMSDTLCIRSCSPAFIMLGSSLGTSLGRSMVVHSRSRTVNQSGTSSNTPSAKKECTPLG